jgi:hypothetical protein
MLVAVGLMTAPASGLLTLVGLGQAAVVGGTLRQQATVPSHQLERRQDIRVSGLHRWTDGSNFRQPGVVDAG